MNASDSNTTRRAILVKFGAALGGLTINSAWGPISPGEARSQGLPWKHLSAAEATTLEALGDVLLPGAREAGIAHYVDDQLGQDTPLLFLRYMDYPESYLEFYRQGLGSLQGLSQARFGTSFEACTPERKTAIVRDMSKNSVSGWGGPPASLFYFVVRNDAVDVYYGTPAGFKKLDVPYMALIEPPKEW